MAEKTEKQERLNPLNDYLFLKMLGEKGDEEYTKSLAGGDDYGKLPNVIAINIVNFEYLETRGYHATFHLREDTERDYILTGALEIHFIDMVKFKRLGQKDIRNDSLQRWLVWLDKDSPEEVIKEAMSMDAAIQRANERMDFVSRDKEALHAYHIRQMALSDWTSGVNQARREGKAERSSEIAREMKAEGLSMGQIVKFTHLSEDEIARL